MAVLPLLPAMSCSTAHVIISSVVRRTDRTAPSCGAAQPHTTCGRWVAAACPRGHATAGSSGSSAGDGTGGSIGCGLAARHVRAEAASAVRAKGSSPVRVHGSSSSSTTAIVLGPVVVVAAVEVGLAETAAATVL